jgi:acetoacetyl-CoA synthetase
MAPSPSHARARTAPASRADLVEVRQGGGQRPLFIADANFGEALALRPIAEQLRIDRPIDLLQMRGGDSHDEPHATIAEMAEALIETMRARQPAGPYAIAGFSVGGIVAYEMACRLRERGDAVDLLALIGVDIFAADRAVFSRLTQASRRLARSLRRLTIRPPRQWAGYAACALRARAKHGMARVGIRMQGAAPTETKRVLPPLYIRRCEDIAAYRPRRYDGTVSLFPSARGAFSAQHPSARRGLRARARGRRGRRAAAHRRYCATDRAMPRRASSERPAAGLASLKVSDGRCSRRRAETPLRPLGRRRGAHCGAKPRDRRGASR